MTRKKIAILGGGMAGLTAAYYLSRSEALRSRYDVTLYQIGWRLGGKGATGRRNGRIEEHGLHIWFGYYDNAFRMLREVFRDWERSPDHPLKSWRDALKPQTFTPIGPDYFPLNWPINAGVPGDGHEFLTPWEAFTELLGVVASAIASWIEAREQQGQPQVAPVAVPPKVAMHLVQAGLKAPPAYRNAHDALLQATALARSLGRTHHGPRAQSLTSVAELVRQTHIAFAASLPDNPDSEQRLIADVLDIFQGYANGFICDFLIAGKTAREVDAQEFRAWIIAHGTTADVANNSFVTRALYDTMFQYEEGDLARPSYAAGTAAQVILRTFACYKGAALWEMQGGMGEVVVAPLYQLLVTRGVKFRFFREVKRLALDATRTNVQQIHLARQADVLDGAYRPIFKCGGLDCWPSEPFWEQLKDGEILRKAGVDFESPWSAYEPAGLEVLENGSDFDTAVLAITAGAFKRLNENPALADELVAANTAFRAMSEHVGLVPSMALQLWSTRSLADLGWKLPKPATVAAVEPLDIWADMSQTLAYEEWAGAKPLSVHYLTGVMKSTAYRAPNSAHDTQAKGEAELTQISKGWLGSQGPRFWPKAVTPDGEFDWDVLVGEEPGPERIASQYVRANISPAECCVGSAAGTTQYRLKAEKSGFANLVLAGCWIDTGFNTTCIEAAVMSGMQAARAIAGEPVHVSGETLLQVPGHGLFSQIVTNLLEDAAKVIETGVREILNNLFGTQRSPDKKP